MFISEIVSFSAGALIAGLVIHILHSQKILATKEELIKLRAKVETSENLQEIIKRDFLFGITFILKVLLISDSGLIEELPLIMPPWIEFKYLPSIIND